MAVKTTVLRVQTSGQGHIENLTKAVTEVVTDSGLRDGIVTLFVKHTTASVLIIEDEPGIRADTTQVWDRLIPADPDWQHNVRNHGEDNAHSHQRGQLQGPSVTIPFCRGELTLGTWQQIVLLDFDTRGRARDLVVQIIGE
jgi:secondary thiamine-phosphate synthase enzyme